MFPGTSQNLNNNFSKCGFSPLRKRKKMALVYILYNFKKSFKDLVKRSFSEKGFNKKGRFCLTIIFCELNV